MPEFLKKRFQSHSVRTYLTVVALISYVFTKFSVRILLIILISNNNGIHNSVSKEWPFMHLLELLVHLI